MKMKLIILYLYICCGLLFHITTSKIIPDRIPQPCSRSIPNYSDCMLNVFKNLGPHMLKGVPEINIPKFDPLDIPFFPISTHVGEFIGISGVLKDLQFWGFDTSHIEDFKFDTKNMNGAMHIKSKQMETLMEYNTTGRLLTLILHGEGYFQATTKDIDLLFKFSLVPVEKLGVKYYKFDEFTFNIPIDDARINIFTRDHEAQGPADLITNFCNANPKRILELMRPINDENIRVYYKAVAEKVLSTIPAEELFPE